MIRSRQLLAVAMAGGLLSFPVAANRPGDLTENRTSIPASPLHVPGLNVSSSVNPLMARAELPQGYDVCAFEGDSASVGSAVACDPYTECDVDRYTCRMRVRSGYYYAAYMAFCSTCRGSISAEPALGGHLVSAEDTQPTASYDMELRTRQEES